MVSYDPSRPILRPLLSHIFSLFQIDRNTFRKAQVPLMKLLKQNRSRLWLPAVLLVMALSVTVFTACTNQPGGTDTTEDPSVTVDTPTETDSDGNPVTAWSQA